MTKTFFTTILLNSAVLLLLLILPSLSNAGQTVTPDNSDTAAMTGMKAADMQKSSQPDSSRIVVAEGEHRCVRHCRRHYEERLQECYEPGHPHHRRCAAWAREREQECLEGCYREHRRW
jgi:hypothetical protein